MNHTAFAGGFFISESPLTDAKRILRDRIIAARRALSPELRASNSRAIAQRFLALPAYLDARVVALYAAVGAEVDVGEIARHAQADGKSIVWPRLVTGQRRLEFAACTWEKLKKSVNNIAEPPPEMPAVAIDTIDCIAVPGVAFDRSGHRLGRGGGYYDAALATLPSRARRIGVAFELQILDVVPADPHDAPVDLVVTEAQILSSPRV